MFAADECEGMEEGDLRCEGCGRSMIGRFGHIPVEECETCAAEFEHLQDAGKIALDGWTLVVVKIDD